MIGAQGGIGFRATHQIPAEGLATYSDADPAAVPGPPLEARLAVQVLEQRKSGWAHIACSNGWTTWGDGRLLVPLTRFVPPHGMATYAATDPQAAPGPRLNGGLDVTVVQLHRDGWAEIACSNGWRTWVDGRLLVDAPAPAAAHAAPPAPAGPPTPVRTAPPSPPPHAQVANPPSAEAMRLAMAQVRARPDFYTRWLPLGGGALVLIGMLLPWIRVFGVGVSSWDVSTGYVFFANTDVQPHIGWVLLASAALIVGYVAAPFVFGRPVSRSALFLGAYLAVLVSGMYFVRWVFRHASGAGMDIGPFFALAGGVVAAVAHYGARPPHARSVWD